jgi:hypothetical protein
MERPSYCRAYLVRDVEHFPFTGGQRAQLGPSDALCFIHDDYRLTVDADSDATIVHDGVDAAWREFCREQLRFAVPAECLP